MTKECKHRWRLTQDDEYDNSLWWVVCESCKEYGEHTQVNEQITALETQRDELLAVCDAFLTKYEDVSSEVHFGQMLDSAFSYVLEPMYAIWRSCQNQRG